MNDTPNGGLDRHPAHRKGMNTLGHSTRLAGATDARTACNVGVGQCSFPSEHGADAAPAVSGPSHCSPPYAPNIARIEDDGSETPMTLSAKACEWKRDGDGGYYVKCGDFRVKTPRQPDFDEDGTAHNFTYCPYCGGRLTMTDHVRVPANSALCVKGD